MSMIDLIEANEESLSFHFGVSQGRIDIVIDVPSSKI